ncbi:MAG: AAA family ATPase [Pseudomonadota bacterium]
MKQRLEKLRDYLLHDLIERDTAVRLALLSALAGEHLLLIGAPGTAKSILARRLHLVFQQGDYFERLLTRFSVPEELFGPLSIRALENDRYERLTQGYLPSANIAFIDEIFKANSAILNALLSILNEREFDNGDQRIKLPLIAVIGASNELPDNPELDALYDRFLCRCKVSAVSADAFPQLLTLSDSELQPLSEDERLGIETVREIQQQARGVILPEDVILLLDSLRRYLQQNNLYVSDRRWRKIIKLMQVSAVTNERDSVSIWDCWLLQHCLWDEPRHRMLIADWYQSHMGIGSGFNHERLEKLVQTWETTLQSESSSTIQSRDAAGKPLFLDAEGQPTTLGESSETAFRGGDPLYLAPPDEDDRSNKGSGYTRDELLENFFDDIYQQCHINGQWQHVNAYTGKAANHLVHQHQNRPMMEVARHAEVFINGRARETQAILDDIDILKGKLQQQLLSLEQSIAEHLWIPAGFSENAAQSLSQSIDAAADLAARMELVTTAYAGLPRE